VLANPYEILCLRDFDETMSGGDQIPTWLNYQREAIEARPESSPVIVLLDWDAKDDLIAKIDKRLSGHATSKCVKWPEDLANDDLNRSWLGIERFLSTSFIEWMANRHGVELLSPAKPAGSSWRYGIEKKVLSESKTLMRREVLRRGRAKDIRPLIGALGWLTDHGKAAAPML
jgi:5S rRNA maturation endonuclease (ribonuclease M5)